MHQLQQYKHDAMAHALAVTYASATEAGQSCSFHLHHYAALTANPGLLAAQSSTPPSTPCAVKDCSRVHHVQLPPNNSGYEPVKYAQCGTYYNGS
jgi:hypothetical protein